MIITTQSQVSAVAGQIRFNQTTSMIEMYDGLNWQGVTAQLKAPELIMKVGSVTGIMYNCVEPHGRSWTDMFQWCVDTMGDCGNSILDSKDFVVHARWYMKENMFWFKEPEDRVMFVLRWS